MVGACAELSIVFAAFASDEQKKAFASDVPPKKRRMRRSIGRQEKEAKKRAKEAKKAEEEKTLAEEEKKLSDALAIEPSYVPL